MQEKKVLIPRAPVGRILIAAGAKRVSASAVEEFAQVLEKRAEEIAKRALQLARHAGRKTVNAEDVRIALK
jgi:histone H3/H4